MISNRLWIALVKPGSLSVVRVTTLTASVPGSLSVVFVPSNQPWIPSVSALARRLFVFTWPSINRGSIRGLLVGWAPGRLSVCLSFAFSSLSHT